MFDTLVESAEIQRAAHDLEHFVAAKKGLHGDWVEDEEKIAMIGKDSCGRVACQQVDQLAESLDSGKRFLLVSRPVLLSISADRAEEGRRILHFVEKRLAELAWFALRGLDGPVFV